MLAEDAVVLDTLDAGGAGSGYGLVVDYAVLQPQAGNAEANHVVHNGWHEFRGAEDVNQVDSVGGRLGAVEVGIALHAHHLVECRVDGKDAVAVFGEIAADVVAGAPGLVAHADEGDGLRGAKDFVDDGWIAHSLLMYERPGWTRFFETARN